MKSIVLFSLFISSVLCQFNALAIKQKVCLYSSASNKILAPLQLKNTNCASNTSYCMNTIYKYGNFQYQGTSTLKPQKGEAAMFLSQDEAGRIDFVSFLNANISTRMNVTLQITGAEPAGILLKDDPEKDGDSWAWDSSVNTGKFTWVTLPGYTDGVIIGHITFVDNYCVRSTFVQPNNAIQKLSILSGTITNVTRVLTVNYVPGSTFEFCQYPTTATQTTNATCPNSKDGSASVSIVFGPSNNRFTWYDDFGTIIYQNSAVASNLAPGIYHVFVNDTSGQCTADRTVVISGPPALIAPTVSTTKFSCSVKGSASVNSISGGKSPYTYSWKKGSITVGTGSSISDLEMGDYTVTVMDSCGTSVSSPFVIETVGCCGDGICQSNEVCGSGSSFCEQDCGTCCLPGTYVSGEECVVCPPGSRGTTYQATSCDSCPANTFNAGGSDLCTACPEHSYSTIGSGKCEKCEPGKVRPADEQSCRVCPSGQFAELCGGGCVSARAGSKAVGGGWHEIPCEPGTYSSAGSSVCSVCPVGSYSGAGASDCTSCPDGTTTLSSSSTHLLSCA